MEVNSADIAEAWHLRRVSIVNASTVIAAATDDGHNYRHYAADALRSFTQRWLASPLPNPIYNSHMCTAACRMFEYVPPGRISGDIFICRASADMHVCTKDLCRHTHPQHGFPGFNNARRAVCHVCELTRRVFSVNPDQTIGGGGGDGGEGGDDDFGGGGTGADCLAVGDIDPDIVGEHISTDTDAIVPIHGSVLLAAVVVAPPTDTHQHQLLEPTLVKSAPKRKRATAAAAAVITHAKAEFDEIQEREQRKKRFHIYADVVRELMPEVASARIHAWQNAIEHIWSVIRMSPGFELNRSQLQPQFFALVCLNYMRNIGLTIRVASPGGGGMRQLVCVLPPVPYIQANMPDIKHINKRQFTPAERALMCCVNELSVAQKTQLAISNTTLELL